MRRLALAAVAAGSLLAIACGSAVEGTAEVPPEARSAAAVDAVVQAVNAPDRSEADRALDEGRDPVATFRFFGIRPGMRVAELGAGGGYTSELLARIVGPTGQVIGQNSPFILERFAEAPWSERLQKPIMSNVVRWDGPFEDPFPPGTRDLDAVVNILFYHDTYWQGVDRRAMNEAIFAALKPGGVYGIVDHSAAEGRGAEDVQTLHRIEESELRRDIEAVGFVLAESADFLRNPEDTRDWSASPGKAGERRGSSDRFVLRFVKP